MTRLRTIIAVQKPNDRHEDAPSSSMGRSAYEFESTRAASADRFSRSSAKAAAAAFGSGNRSDEVRVNQVIDGVNEKRIENVTVLVAANPICDQAQVQGGALETVNAAAALNRAFTTVRDVSGPSSTRCFASSTPPEMAGFSGETAVNDDEARAGAETGES